MNLRQVHVFTQKVVDVGDIGIEYPRYPDNSHLARLHVHFTDGEHYVNVFPSHQSRREFINSLREMATEIEKLETPYIYK